MYKAASLHTCLFSFEYDHWGETCHFDAFKYFCDYLFGSRIKELEIIIWNLDFGCSRGLMKPWEVIKPLTILRNVENFNTREATLADIPYDQHGWNTSSGLPLAIPNKLNVLKTKLHRRLKRLVESNKPVERLSDMHRRLLRFARSFENFPPWKAEMGILGEPHIDIRREDHDLWSREGNYLLYPFTGAHRSFAEEALREAYNASRRFDYVKFKSVRADIVKYFQPQYYRIVDASRALIAVIKEEKFERGSLDPKSANPISLHKMAELTILAEKYASALERDKDFITELEFRRMRRKLKKLRADYPREVKLRKVERMLEDARGQPFKVAFKELVDDLENQFMDIVQAWRDLFKDDSHGKTMCEI